ncbi:MAG: gliding motility-associated C-terminal domain-containing protein, partial [Bacteroidetes bacterium]|nr:gliding motility-associated C-terminal domain-containing protein [Bacteroidota bacterium]
SSITVSPATTTNYTVNYTLNGCSKSASNTVTVAPALSANLTGGDEICEGESTDLTIDFSGSGPYNIVLNDGTANINLNNISSNPYIYSTGIAGNYSLVSVSNASCSGNVSGSAVVIVNQEILISSESSSCDGSGNYTVSFVISGGDPSSYTVNGMNGGSISAVAPYTFTSNLIATGTPNYSFFVNDVNSCNVPNVVGNQSCGGCGASVTMSGGGSACSGGTVNITLTMVNGTGPWNVTINDGTSDIPLNGISSPYTYAASTSGNYSLVSATDFTSCIASTGGSANVNIKPNPTVSVVNSGPSTICLGETTTLTANPSISGGTYLWNNGATTNSISVTPGSTGISNYSVVYTLNGCSGNGSGSVTVNEVPSLSVNDGEICSGESVVLTALASPTGGTYDWQPTGETTVSITVSPAVSKNYDITYTLNGCSVSEISSVVVKPTPSISVTSGAICQGESYTIVSTVSVSGGSYLWSPNNETTPDITVSPATGISTYDLTYTLNGCTDVQTSTVTVNETPTIAVTDDEICDGEVGTLTTMVSVTGGNYTWGPGTFPNSDVLTDTPNATTNYTVDYIVNGCSVSGSGQIVVNPSPSITVADKAICEGESTTLEATTSNPGGSYSWSPGAFGDVAIITVTPSTTTIYSLDYTLDGCTVNTTATVTVNSPSTLTVNDETICSGEAADLTATPGTTGGTFYWSPGGQTSNMITVSPSSTSTYTVQYTVNGCLSTATGDITVNPKPEITAQDTLTICDGESATIEPVVDIANGNFSWLPDNEMTPTITKSPTTTSKYYVMYSVNGCSDLDSTVIKVLYPATITVNDVDMCEGESVTLTAVTNGNPSTISWSPGTFPNGPSINVSPTTTTTYTATIIENGCENTADAVVNVFAIPSITASNNGPYCEGNTINLFSTSDATNGNYDWTGPNGFNVNGQNVNRTNSQFADAGTYTITVTENGCSNLATTEVVVNQPDVSVIAPAGPFCENDGTVNLQINFLGGTWNGPGIIDVSTGVFSPSMANIGLNTINWTPGSGACQTNASIQIMVNELPIVAFSTSDPNGCSPFITSFIDETLPPSATVSWSFGNGSNSNQLGTVSTLYPDPGTYTVTLLSTSAAGCSNSLTKTNYVSVFQNAQALFDFTPNEITNLHTLVNFINNSLFSDQFEWTINNTVVLNTENPSFDFVNNTGEQIIRLVANNAGNCPDTMIRSIIMKEELIFYIPNTFTPDGDKFNQYFSPIFTTGFDPYDFNMKIFNRWGALIFESNDYTRGWDGSLNNQLVEEGVYMYKIVYREKYQTDKTVQNGTVILLK